MQVGGKHYVIDYSRADKMYHVTRIGRAGFGEKPVLLPGSYTSYLNAEREVKLNFLTAWVQQYVHDNPVKLWHSDEVFEEVELETMNGLVNGEWLAFFTSKSHGTTFRYYVQFAEDYTFTPVDIEVSPLAECHACDWEWSQNHPQPHA